MPQAAEIQSSELLPRAPDWPKLLISQILMSSIAVRRVLLLTLAVVALPTVAAAQIYTWRDDAGNLIVSKTQRTGAQTYSVANAASAIRTTQPVLSRKAQAFEGLILQQAQAHNVRPDLVRAVIQAESAFNPAARSHKGAMGLMQLMPATAVELGVTDPWDPAQNIRGGVTYLRRLLDQYGGNEELALAAYNAGPGAVDRYGAVPPYRETRDYIERIRNHSTVRKAPATRLYRKVEIVNGREVVTFTSTPSSEATLVSVRKR